MQNIYLWPWFFNYNLCFYLYLAFIKYYLLLDITLSLSTTEVNGHALEILSIVDDIFTKHLFSFPVINLPLACKYVYILLLTFF